MSSLGSKMKKVDYHIPFYKNHYFHVFNRGTEDEFDFIINYDMKYRMGKENISTAD
jgi:hypothetical protein